MNDAVHDLDYRPEVSENKEIVNDSLNYARELKMVSHVVRYSFDFGSSI